MELFPKGVATDQTAPRRPFPVQSQGISSHSLVALARTLEYFLPLKLWPSRLLLENKSCMSRFDFTYCSSGFVFAFGDFSFLWQLFMFQKISKAATLFRYFTFQWGHVITHSSRQEWHQRSHRLDHIIWQIWDVILIFIWSNQGALFSATFPCQISFNQVLHLTFETVYPDGNLTSQVLERRSLLSSPLLLTTCPPWPVTSNLWRREQLEKVRRRCLNVGCGAGRGSSCGPAEYTLFIGRKYDFGKLLVL